jgi:hypothetical protein
MPITLEDVREAKTRIAPYVYRTDVTQMQLPGGGELYIKLENLQYTGAFKVRGAFNCILQLTEAQWKAGVLAASAGNHAQGVARAARELGLDCTIVMPAGAPLSKIAATEHSGPRWCCTALPTTTRAPTRSDSWKRQGRRSYIRSTTNGSSPGRAPTALKYWRSPRRADTGAAWRRRACGGRGHRRKRHRPDDPRHRSGAFKRRVHALFHRGATHRDARIREHHSRRNRR